MKSGDAFPGGGTAGELLRATDWSTTPLGAMSSWPLSLKTIVRIMLSTHQATCLFWGPELVNLYNDGFIPILGEKHPTAMGQRARECWADAWPVVGGLLEGVVTKGEAVLFSEMLVPIVREGKLGDAWWNYSYSPAFDDDGNVVGVLVVATETTAEVTGRKHLEAASLAKDEFLAIVSHELRTPLNAILGWSKLLTDTPDTRRLEQGLAIIERNARAQAKLIDDILDVSRIITGKVVIDRKRLQLAPVVQNAVESIRPAAMAKGITLEVMLDDASTDFVADEDRLQQIVWNLLSNAVKFTPSGGSIRVTGSTARSRVTIRVADTGKGISAQFLPHVFERFRQDDGSTTKRFAGLGLGLAIVRHLVELHGGTVEARSEGEGRGATFEVVLPIRAVELSGDRVTSTRPTSAVTESPAAADILKGVHVLLVDDEGDARDLVATVLEEAGATVKAAPSVAEAMTYLGTTPVDALVSDIGMPAVDGYTLIQRVRTEAPEAMRRLPALALTAFARKEDRNRALAAGFHEHVAKPVDPDVLVRAVATLLRR